MDKELWERNRHRDHLWGLMQGSPWQGKSGAVIRMDAPRNNAKWCFCVIARVLTRGRRSLCSTHHDCISSSCLYTCVSKNLLVEIWKRTTNNEFIGWTRDSIDDDGKQGEDKRQESGTSMHEHLEIVVILRAIGLGRNPEDEDFIEIWGLSWTALQYGTQMVAVSRRVPVLKEK